MSVDVHCCAEGPWRDAAASAQPFSRYCRVRVNPPDVLTAGSPAISGFIGNDLLRFVSAVRVFPFFLDHFSHFAFQIMSVTLFVRPFSSLYLNLVT